MDAVVIRELLLLAWLAGSGAVPGAAGGPTPRGADEAAADTVVDVRRGDALVVETLEGRLLVEGWDQDRISLTASPGVALRRSGNRVTVAGVGRRSRDGLVRIHVPTWMPVTVSGRELEAEVKSVAAPVNLRTVEGDLAVSDITGPVSLRSVDGEVRATRVRGSVTALAVGDDVTLRDVRGDVRVESTDGDLVLEDVDGASVDATTVDGDVLFEGPLRQGGRYRFVTHDGDVTVRVPRDSGAAVSVSTYDGEFTADFPVVLERFRGGREMGFTLGRGGSTLVIQAFDGDIRLGWR